jgi:hypothetical protein
MAKKIEAASILLIDPIERAAVQSGEIIGDEYSDGDIYGDVVSTLMFRQKQLQENLNGT